jgi:hypothetical protein
MKCRTASGRFDGARRRGRPGWDTRRLSRGGSGRKPREEGVGASSATAPPVVARPEVPARLLEVSLDRETMMAAYHHVVANGGAAGVDGRTVDELKAFNFGRASRKSCWPVGTGRSRCVGRISRSPAAVCGPWALPRSWTG